MPRLLQSKPTWIFIIAGLFLVYLMLFRWPAERQVRAKQESLLVALQDASWRRCEKLVSTGYNDRWGWGHDDLVLVMKDMRTQFLVLTLTLEESEWAVGDGTGTVTGRLRVSGRPLAIGGEIQRRLNSVESPLSFTWRKESFWPWSWHLMKVDHPDLEIPDSYTPGDLLRLREGEFDY